MSVEKELSKQHMFIVLTFFILFLAAFLFFVNDSIVHYQQDQFCKDIGYEAYESIKFTSYCYKEYGNTFKTKKLHLKCKGFLFNVRCKEIN